MFKKKVTLTLTVLFIVLIGAFIYQWWQIKQESPEQEETHTPETSDDINLKTYRNEEWGFEFQYPKDWKLVENSFYSPFSKINLQGGSAADYNPLVPAFLINIVTPDFVERQFFDLKNIASEIIVNGVAGSKYVYEEQGTQITIILPFGKYKMILDTTQAYEDIFNQIIFTFKFIEN